HVARGVRQVRARRHRQVGEAGQRHRHEGGLTMRAKICSFLAALAVALPAAAQPCPEKNVLYWQAFPAGGESDLSARHQQLVLKKKCPSIETIIQYKPGAGGGLLWTQLNQLPGDGYNIAGINLPHMVLQPMEGTVQYKTEDVTPVYWFHYTPDALVVGMDKRHPLLPDVPTFRELGTDWVDGAYRGIGVPKSTPPGARKRLSDLWAALNADPEMKELAAKSGFELIDVGIDKMDAFMREKSRAYTEAGKRMGLGK